MPHPHEPVHHIRLDGEKFSISPKNASLYTYAGSLSGRNHVFIKDDTLPNNIGCLYIFAFKQPQFNVLAHIMITQGFESHLHLTEVEPDDELAFQISLDLFAAEQSIDPDLPDWLPEINESE